MKTDTDKGLRVLRLSASARERLRDDLNMECSMRMGRTLADEFISLGRLLRLPRGRAIIRAGEFEDNLYVLAEGIMRIYDDPAHSIVIDCKNGERELYDVEAIQTNDNQTASGIIDAFVNCIEQGTEPAIAGASVLPAMRAVFASIESSKTGARVSIPLS